MLLIENEEWKDVEGYEGHYKVSVNGTVKSLDRYVNSKNNSKQLKKGKILSPVLKQSGYLVVNLYKDKKMKSKIVHRLVANAFIPNMENKPEVNHIDGDKTNNKAENLEWATSKENQIHAYKTGLQSTSEYMKYTRSKSAMKFNIQKAKPVYQLSNNSNDILRLWYSTSEAGNTGIYSEGGVAKCCNNTMKSHRGYSWKYIEAPFEEGFIFIVEGCDASGKSTLIEELHKKTNFKVVKGSDFSIAERGVENMYDYMMDLIQSKDVLIMDRSFISNLVYAPLFDKNILSDCHVSNLIDSLKKKSITIYLKGNESIIIDRLTNRGDDYVETKDIKSIIKQYEKIIPDIKKEMSVMEFDIKDYSSLDVSKIILSIMRNIELIT